MMHAHLGPLLGDALSQTKYELLTVGAMTQWWHWLLLAGISALVTVFVVLMYRRDAVELPGGIGWALLLLRVGAMLGILFAFLHLERRTERQLVKNSRVFVLIDTSQSMGLRDVEAKSGDSAGESRIGRIVAELASGTLIADLRAKHDVNVLRFDQYDKPVEVASFPKLVTSDDADRPQTGSGEEESPVARTASWTLLAIAAGLMFASLVVGVGYSVGRLMKFGDGVSWAFFASVLLLVAGVTTLAAADLGHPKTGLLTELAFRVTSRGEPSGEQARDQSEPEGQAEETPEEAAEKTPPVDWQTELMPRGTETRLGEALTYLINQHRGGALAGVVLMSDGRSNAGAAYTDAIELAQEADVPLYTVGFGSDTRPANVRIVDVEAPARVYPGDHFTLTGFVQARGVKSSLFEVSLYSGPATQGEPDPDQQTFEEAITVDVGKQGEVIPVKFEITPTEPGRRAYRLVVKAPPEDGYAGDNAKSVRVRVIDRKNRVLLFAGGPTREFRFLRNQLYRDKDTAVDVLLQTARGGISQDADDILNDFPRDESELFGSTESAAGSIQQGYDCIVAFDPDWRKLDEDQILLLERWVAEKAGGLGPVYTPEWASQLRGGAGISTIKGLYPVEFYGRGTSVGLDRFGSATPAPIWLTRDGVGAQFLRLDDNATRSEAIWADFEGVFGYYAVRGIKPGATVFARFGDEKAAIDDELPVYMAGHFYGAGRVFFMASGEMWRMRSMDDAYFEQFYTKLIRYASGGRLLRDSSRGVLMVDKQRCLLGEPVAVRAQLSDAQHRPLDDEQVSAVLVKPDGIRTMLPMRAIEAEKRDGMYAGQFTALDPGDYRIELVVPESGNEEVLTREVRVRLPDLEIQRPERDDKVLKELAERTHGKYYIGMDAAMGRRGIASLASTIVPENRLVPLPNTPDKDFQRRLMGWLLGILCGLLCFEWLVRRLSKLA